MLQDRVEQRAPADLPGEPRARLAGEARAGVRDTASAQYQHGAHTAPNIPNLSDSHSRSNVDSRYKARGSKLQNTCL